MSSPSSPSAMPDSGSEMRLKKGPAIAWCLFDWANSAFPALITTFVFSAYFTAGVAETPEQGQEWWAWGAACGGLLIALLSPPLGAIADRGGPRKPWILALTILTAVAASALWLIEPDASFMLPALAFYILALIGNEVGIVFYNAMLPDLAPQRMMGRLSGWAWGLGYLGALVCLGLSLLLFVQPDPSPFGLDRESAEHIRIIGPLVGLWSLVFALPLLLYTPDLPRREGVTPRQAIREGLVQLWSLLKSLPGQPVLARYLVARMLYNDGMVTLFTFGGLYATGTMGMNQEELILFAIGMNVTAGLGAAAMAWMDDYAGSKPTILLSLVGLMVFGAAVLLVDSISLFMGCALALGLFMGPVQAASRTLMARLTRPEQRAEMFGLYALSGKATAFLGPALVGIVTSATGNQSWGMSVVLLLLLAGTLLLLGVRAGDSRGG